MRKLLFAANGEEMDSKEEINSLWKPCPDGYIHSIAPSSMAQGAPQKRGQKYSKTSKESAVRLQR